PTAASASAPMQSAAKRTVVPRAASSAGSVTRRLISGTGFPFGRPKCASSTGLPPFATISRMVGTIRSIRVVSLTRPSATGTLMSTRVSTTLPSRSMSSSVLKPVTSIPLSEQRLGPGRDGLGGDAEMLVEPGGRTGGAETFHADEIGLAIAAALAGEPAVPAETARCLDADADGTRGQDAAAVALVLRGEEFPAGHGDDARTDALALENGAGLEGDVDLGAGGEQDDRATMVGLGKDIGAHRAQVPAVVHGPDRREILAGEGEDRGTVGMSEGEFPGLGGLDDIGGAEDAHVRRRA